jgi:hypothetical protein
VHLLHHFIGIQQLAGHNFVPGDNVLGLMEAVLFVVVWEPRSGRGSGHQLALDKEKAERISRMLSKAMPDATIQIEHADAYAAAAVMAPRQRRPDRGYPTRNLTRNA